jgi:hypothetical protein
MMTIDLDDFWGPPRTVVLGRLHELAYGLLLGTEAFELVEAALLEAEGDSPARALVHARERFAFPSCEWAAAHVLLMRTVDGGGARGDS